MACCCAVPSLSPTHGPLDMHPSPRPSFVDPARDQSSTRRGQCLVFNAAHGMLVHKHPHIGLQSRRPWLSPLDPNICRMKETICKVPSAMYFPMFQSRSVSLSNGTPAAHRVIVDYAEVRKWLGRCGAVHIVSARTSIASVQPPHLHPAAPPSQAAKSPTPRLPSLHCPESSSVPPPPPSTATT